MQKWTWVAAVSATMMASTWADAPSSMPTSAPSRQPTAAATPSTAPAADVPTTAVRRGALVLAVSGQGAFDPVDPFEVRLRLKAYPGELTIVAAAPAGEPIKRGQVLLELDPSPIERLITAAKNEDAAARAGLERAIADGKVAEAADALAEKQQHEALKEAEDGVKWFETVDGPQLLKTVDVATQQAKNQMDDEQDELNELKKMYKTEELTSATADIVVKRAVRQLELSKTAWQMAVDRGNKTTTFIYPLLKQRVYETRDGARQQYALFESAQKQSRVLRQTNLAAANAAADASARHLDELTADAAQFKITAPADGTVVYGQVAGGVWTPIDPRSLRPGEHVTAQSILMTLYRPGRLRVALDLPEQKFFIISPGQKASIHPVAFPELKYEGMTDISPHAPVAGGNYALLISTGEVDTRLIPGMKADVSMDVPLVDNALLVPTSAVKEGVVSVKTACGLQSRHVITGRTDGKSIELLSGVHEGEHVLTTAP